jgi:alkanesulfonate monooxygenase SsuD/methylene tetrahydromethanopterin reductase-like flavin-dependent oxidoreductase (luciferase family)
MEYGIGIDASLGLTFAEQRTLATEAAAAGYASIWTPSGPATRDGFHACAQHWGASASVVEGGLPVGIAVIPAPAWTVASLAQQAGTLCDLTGGRFILGLGTGGYYTPAFRRMHGLPDWPVVRMMREYVVTLRELFAGKVVHRTGTAVKVDGLQVTGRPLDVPLYLAALGPQMLRLTGEVADGVSLNWTAPSLRPWCREQISAGAERAGRDPSAVRVTEYIRVCIDDDEEAARRAFVLSFMGYALARPGASKEHGYRGHFARMGFDAALIRIEARRDDGASDAELVDLFPPELLREVGYYGRAAEAPTALERLSAGLDHGIVRIVGVRRGMEAARAVLQAARPVAVQVAESDPGRRPGSVV